MDMVDQTTLGHRYILQQFGVVPTVTWQIDPFGHSSTQAALFGPLSGIDAVFFARIDYQDKQRRAAAKELEMVWRSSPSLGEKAQVFAGAFPGDYLYFSPPGFCWDITCTGTEIQNNKSLPGYNLDQIVDSFVQTAQGQAAQTNGNNIMWTLGGDFEVSAPISALTLPTVVTYLRILFVDYSDVIHSVCCCVGVNVFRVVVY